MKEVVVILEELLSEAVGGDGKFSARLYFFSYFIFFAVFKGVSITERQYDCSYGICTPLSMECVFSQ